MSIKTKVICIKERHGDTHNSFYKLVEGDIYYMSLKEQVHSIGGPDGYEVGRKITGYDLYKNEHDSSSWFNMNTESFHKYFITFDQRRQDKLNTILDENT